MRGILANVMFIVIQILMFCIQKFMKVKKKMIPTLHCGGIETRLSLKHLSGSTQTKNYKILNLFSRAGIFFMLIQPVVTFICIIMYIGTYPKSNAIFA